MEKFIIPEHDLVRVPEEKLRALVVAIFAKMGAPPKDCELGADVLIDADLRGVQSHGVSNMLRKYVRDYRAGKLNPNPKLSIIRESASVASVDADKGLGIIVAPKMMELAIEKAAKTGVGMVTIKNSGHMGMVSYYPLQATKSDMIGMAMTSGRPSMLPTYGSEVRLGTNPIALAAPASTLAPFVYDASTTVISANKLGLAKRLGVKIPAGWIANEKGEPIMEEFDLSSLKEEELARPRLLPLGSTPEQGSHKGYGLAGVVEILSGILAGAGFSAMAQRDDFSHCVIAYDLKSFTDPKEFKETMDEFLKTLISTKPAKNQTRVFYPGQKEAEALAKNKIEGIPLHKEVVGWFRTISKELSVNFDL